MYVFIFHRVLYAFLKPFTLLVVCHRTPSLSSDYYIDFFIAIAVVMQLLIWFLKSPTQDAIYTSLIGLFYGPVFPAALGMANDILPDEVHMVAMALM
jgi:fucose permease